MNKVQKLKIERSKVIFQINEIIKVSEYPVLKKKLELIDQEIAKASGNFESFSAVKTIKERIDELETKKIRLEIEKSKIGNIVIYRSYVDQIEKLKEQIEFNRDMLKKLGA